MTVTTLLVLTCATLALGQRPFFAGSKPIGIPEVTTEALADRFGEVDGTTQRLPIEANGDRDLVDRLSKLPIDKQPFWLINWQALEAHRQKPQSYPQKPNQFIDSFQNGDGTPSGNSTVTSNSGSNGNSSIANSSGSVSDIATSNRFGVEELPRVPSSDQENKFQNSSSSGSGNSNSNTGNSGVASSVNKNTTYFVPQPFYL